MPTVSVIIPTYNRALYLCEAIDSVINQTYNDVEIIVIDDGSTDDTQQRLKQYKDAIKYIYQSNSGSAIARNRGILSSTGKYIAFLDSDDLWYPTKLEKQVRILDKNEDIGFVYCDYAKGHNTVEGQKGHLETLSPPSGYIFNHLVDANYICTPSVIIRRSVFPNSGFFDPTLLRSQDYDLWLRLAYCCKCYFISEVLTLVREHSERITKDLNKAIYVCSVRELQIIRWAHVDDMAEKFSIQASLHYKSVAHNLRINKQYSKSVYCYRKAALYANTTYEKIILYVKLLLIKLTPYLVNKYDTLNTAKQE